jgi:glutathione S-transferase
MKPLRLYASTIPSGNVYKIELLLAQLGLEIETVKLDILAAPPETRRPEYLRKNPNGRVPLLELDDGRCVAESNAILHFLAEGTPFLPTDPFLRAKVLEWCFFEQYSHEPYVAVLKFWTYWGGLSHCEPRDVERWRIRGQAALDVMALHLVARPYFVGDRYGIADIALFAYTQSAEAIGYRLAPSVAAWLERVRRQPDFVAIQPPSAASAAGRTDTSANG